MANRAGAGCFGWVAAGVLLIALIGKCTGDTPTTTEPQELTPSVQNWRFVRPASANCRASGSTTAGSITQLQRNDLVGVLRSESGWSLIDRSDDCWVRSDLLSADRVAEPAPVRAFSSAGVGSQSGGGSRSSGRTSSSSGSVYYQNCSAARAAGAAPVYRGEPGYARRLDRDGDGVGCE